MTEPNREQIANQYALALGIIDRLRRSNVELIASLKECLAVSAAAMRVIAKLDACTLIGDDMSTREQAFLSEVKLAGVPDGFGVRAKAAITKAEDRA